MYGKILLIPIIFAIVAVNFDKNLRGYLLTFINRLIGFNVPPHETLFTNDELKLYNGIDNPQLYLAVLGKVYDVTKGSDHYGPGKSYHFFTGKDGSRSFVTGKFEEEHASDEVADLTSEDLRSINHWVKFYSKQYKNVGKLIGRYYNKDGKVTAYGNAVKKLIKSALEQKESEDLEKMKFPPCNIEWNAEKGTHVWCTSRSGGIERNWDGVPRQFYEPEHNNYRCACISEENKKLKNLKEYDGCEATSKSCYIKI